MRNTSNDKLTAVSTLVTLSPTDGGLVCQVVSTALTVCRRLPAPMTWFQVVLCIVGLGVFLALWGTALLYLDELRRVRRRANRRATPLPSPTAEIIPFIHLPKREPADGQP